MAKDKKLTIKSDAKTSRIPLLLVAIAVFLTFRAGSGLWKLFEEQPGIIPPFESFQPFLLAALIIVVASIRSESPGYISDIKENAVRQFRYLSQGFSELFKRQQAAKEKPALVDKKKQMTVKATQPSRQGDKKGKNKAYSPSQVEKLKQENTDLKKMYSEQSLELRRMKKELAKLSARKKGKKG